MLSHSIVSDIFQPFALYAARLLCPWDSPGKNIEVGCHFFLQTDLPDPGIKPESPVLQAASLTTEPSRKPL